MPFKALPLARPVNVESLPALRPQWIKSAFFGMHYDLHAEVDDDQFGCDLTAEMLHERLSRVRPDVVQYDCKGHRGYSCYHSSFGPSPTSLQTDQLAIYRRVTRSMGLPLLVHYSGVIDEHAVQSCPGWAVVRADGKVHDGTLAGGRSTCLLGDYQYEKMIPQLLEVIDRYDVDGFWIDGDNWAAEPCWCDRCRKRFTRTTGIHNVPHASGDPNWGSWLAFHRDLFEQYVNRYARAIHDRKPDCMVCSNWMYSARHPGPIRAEVDFLSGDCTPLYGVEPAALESRVLDQRPLPWNLMVWGFVHGVAKPLLHLCQEATEAMAHGGGVLLYGRPERSGWLPEWENEVYAGRAEFCRERQSHCFQTESAAEAAVLLWDGGYYAQADSLYRFNPALDGVKGALHLASECGLSVDVLLSDNLEQKLSQYRLVVVPLQVALPDGIVAALMRFCRHGGVVLFSGPTAAEAHPQLLGVSVDMRGEDKAGYLVPRQGTIKYRPVTIVSPANGTDALFWFFRRRESDATARISPAVTRHHLGAGQVVAMHCDFFGSYVATHTPYARQLFSELLETLAIPWRVALDASPRCEMVQRTKDNLLLIHLLNRGAGETLSSSRPLVDDLPAMDNVTVRVRMPHAPRDISLQPSRQPLEVDYADGLLTLTVPRVAIMETVVIDTNAADWSRPCVRC